MVFAVGVAGFVALNSGCLLDQRGIPGLAEASRLRELGRGNDGEISALPATGASESESVQTFDVTGSNDAKTRDAGICAQSNDLLLDCHVSEQIGDALVGGEVDVFKA